jgi:hypothetical protein
VSARQAVVSRVVPPLAAVAVRALGATLRLRVAGAEPLRPLWAAGRPLIYAAWHGRILMLPWLNAYLRRRAGARACRVLASRSGDGDLVARYVQRFGLPVVRGSSSRGGAAAVRELAATLRGGDDIVVVPDGPRGPRCELQPGVVMLAAVTGAPIVPVAFAARPARRLASWDQFLVPLPFARGVVAFGPVRAVARDDDREKARAAVERALIEITAIADEMVSA